ncbi:DUF5522 domain-containing protein [Neolewinella persica]|uniref:DUF5522 domain-containing protein n=1 Tax=Neolewinella persica TaxID=70998 RepID=UPI00036380D8|nr:DUF5522 domain-containing protein [Neolewinella persica]
MPQPNKDPQSPKKKEDTATVAVSEDYYFDDNGLMVMTAAFHSKRGFCCGNACRHCPYDHVNVTEK